MGQADNQLKNFLRALEAYPQDTPLTKFLPAYFRQNRQMGSSDRRITSRLLYNYFRLGKACAGSDIQIRLLIAEFLCNNSGNELLEKFLPELNERTESPVTEKISYLQKQFQFRLDEVFPFTSHLSAGIQKEAFLQSFFQQPDLFIRVYPGKEGLVESKFKEAEVLYARDSGHAFRLANGTKLDVLFPNGTEGLFEVQDLSSQLTGNYLEPQKYDAWWDACAASGGKSLLLYSIQPEIKLLVSDLRESVLNNLEVRFANAGVLKFQKKQLDLTQNVDSVLHHYEFDGIILDAPCTGSGTWGRTPEMISQFDEHTIGFFQNLQKTITANVISYLKPGKPLIYITCSVFKEENEDIIEYLVNSLGLRLEKSEILQGYTKKADTMFAARLIRQANA